MNAQIISPHSDWENDTALFYKVEGSKAIVTQVSPYIRPGELGHILQDVVSRGCVGLEVPNDLAQRDVLIAAFKAAGLRNAVDNPQNIYSLQHLVCA